MRIISLIVFVLVYCKAFAQKYELIHRSDYRHNYQVSKAVMIEDHADTASANYIASVKISDAHEHLQKPAAWIDLIRIKAREYGANAYAVIAYQEDEATVSATLNFYFGSLKFLERNALKRESTKAIVFNQTRIIGDSAVVYHNRKAHTFDPMRYAEFQLTEKKGEIISTNKEDLTAIRLFYKKKAEARYFIVPARKNSVVFNSNKIHPNAPNILVEGVPINFRRNKPYELNYQTGRFLQELYR